LKIQHQVTDSVQASKSAPKSPKVCVIIPLYKNTFSEFEEISITQCFRVLKDFPIIIVKPNSLYINPLRKKFQNFLVESFNDSYFDSVHSYNKLMLSEEFYERFLDYEFMLIHQLDAFVFKDELAYWCRQNYDYIGAPWRIEIEFNSKIEESIWQIKQKFALWLNLKEERYGKYGPKEIIMKRGVGNGGFSLRRVKKFYDLVKKNEKAIDKYMELAKTHPAYNEDMFFGIEANRYFPRLRIPYWEIALKFAVEHLPEKAYKLNGGLPFGCHAWDIYETEFWKDKIESFGYKL
jgi:Protein of unknown function (DUF5672)